MQSWLRTVRITVSVTIKVAVRITLRVDSLGYELDFTELKSRQGGVRAGVRV